MLNISIKTPEVQKLSPKITVVGVGGAGGNAVNNMISSGLEGCEFLVTNTDAQALEGSLCDSRLQLGAHVTGGLGAGAKPEIGEKAAHESLDEVMQYLEGSNMAFITAGMGGGTGTGAAPVIAKADEKLEGSMRVSVVATGIDAASSANRLIGGGTGGRTTIPSSTLPQTTVTPSVSVARPVEKKPIETATLQPAATTTMPTQSHKDLLSVKL